VVYAKGFMSAMAAVYLGLMLPAFIEVYRGLSEQKATGLGAVAGGFLGNLLSPWFWLLAVSFFAIFFIASRAHSTFLRVLFFWIPSVSFSGFSILSVGFFTYLLARAGRT
jgi:hypothetical protein